MHFVCEGALHVAKVLEVLAGVCKNLGRPLNFSPPGGLKGRPGRDTW